MSLAEAESLPSFNTITGNKVLVNVMLTAYNATEKLKTHFKYL